jgi:hypothetical protein
MIFKILIVRKSYLAMLTPIQKRLQPLFPQVKISDLTIRDIYDFEDNSSLYLISWLPANGDRERSLPSNGLLLTIKGVIVYLGNRQEEDAIINAPYTYTPVCPVDTLPTTEFGTFRSLARQEINVDLRAKNFYLPWVDGVVITTFKFKNVTFFSTGSKLLAINSRYGNSATFYEMFLELGGPKIDDIFSNVDGEYSDSITFLIHHPDLCQGTKTEKYYGLYWLMTRALPTTTSYENPTWLKTFEPLTYNQAKSFLTVGEIIDDETTVTGDKRLSGGEALRLYNADFNTSIKLQSSAYSWRQELRSGGSSHTNALLKIYATVTATPKEDYIKSWPILGGSDLDDSWGRFYNSYLCFKKSVPESQSDTITESIQDLFGYAPDGDYTVSPNVVEYQLQEINSKVKGQVPKALELIAKSYDELQTTGAVPGEFSARTRSLLSKFRESKIPARLIRDYLRRLVYEPRPNQAFSSDQLISIVADYKNYRRKSFTNSIKEPINLDLEISDYNTEFPELVAE